MEVSTTLKVDLPRDIEQLHSTTIREPLSLIWKVVVSQVVRLLGLTSTFGDSHVYPINNTLRTS